MSAFSRALASRSTRWRRPSTNCAGRARRKRSGPGGGLEFVHVYGLRPDLLAVTQVWRPAAGGSKLVVASKGAPEAIAELCRIDGARPRRLEDIPSPTWRPMDCGFWASREPLTQETCRLRRANSPSNSSGLSALPIRCGRAPRGGEGMPVSRHPGRHDHRRLSGDRRGHRAPGGARRKSRHDGPGAREHGRSRR